MTDTVADTAPSGIAVLAASGDLDWDDGPFRVRGVALPEDVTTNDTNTEGVKTYWPPDVVEQAAALFEGVKIVDGSEHDPKTAIEKPQPSANTIVGEITDVRYRPGVGVLYEGEVDDPDLVKLIDRNRVDVSPTVFRIISEPNEDGVASAKDVQRVRDLSIVSQGSGPGNRIETAPTAATSAMAAAVLSEAFDESEGTAGADSPTDAAGGSDDGDDPQSTPATNETRTTMSDDLTDKERELLAVARQQDDPTVVEAGVTERLTELEETIDKYADVIEAASSLDDPEVQEAEEAAAMRERVSIVEDLMSEALIERTGLKESTVAAMSFDAIAEEFQDEDGEFSAAALVQEPETGDTDASGDDAGPSEEDKERIKQIETKLTLTGSALPQERVAALEEEACELAGVDDYGAAVEVL